MYIQIFATFSRRSEAKKVAEALIKRRLSGCAQVIGPIESVFRWKGKIEKAKEWLCLIKTTRRNYKKVETAIKKTHSYGVPEIIATPIVAGNPAYLSWLNKETKSPLPRAR